MTVTLANAGAADRRFADFYETPPDATLALLRFLCLPKGTAVWEPAAGDGKIVDVLTGEGYAVTATDLYRDGADFLATTESRGDWIITNPPFSRAAEFIQHAYTLEPRGGFAFLLKSQYWHAAKRLLLFRQSRPDAVLPLTWRPDFLFGQKGGAPTMEVCWSIWRAPYTAQATKYEPLSREDQR